MLEALPRAGACLLFRVESVVCALPIEFVLETMRPLPIQPLVGAPEPVLGLAIVRGIPIPVVDAARLIGAGRGANVTRFITLALGARRVSLAVAEIIGVRALGPGHFEALPPLLTEASADVIAAIGSLDDQLLLLLRGVRLVPDSVFAAADRQTAAR